MSKPIVIGVVVLAIAAGVVYFKDDSADQSATTSATADKTNAARSSDPAPIPDAPADPRLAALQVSPDNGLIKFVVGNDGKVIAEVDQDRTSPSFGKPTREYLYYGNKVVGLTAYRYLSNRVEITRTQVAYKPDGSVDQIKESTELK